MYFLRNCEAYEPKILTFPKVQRTEHVKTLSFVHIKPSLLLYMLIFLKWPITCSEENE